MANLKDIIDYERGYQLSSQNSERLFKIAENAASEMEFGIANSLNILSVEEALKSLFLLIKLYHPNSNINKFNKIFHEHKVKHEQLKLIVEFQDVMKNRIREFYESLVKQVDYLELRYRAAGRINDPFLVSIREDMSWYKTEGDRKVNFGQIFDWIETANNEKNRGFYVDKGSDGEWITPKSVSKEKYEEGKEYRIAIVGYILSIEELFNKLKKIKR